MHVGACTESNSLQFHEQQPRFFLSIIGELIGDPGELTGRSRCAYREIPVSLPGYTEEPRDLPGIPDKLPGNFSPPAHRQ